MTQPAREEVSAERVPSALLIALHDGASHMAQDPNPLIANWGRHLLEDWRSLELLAEKQRTGEPSPEVIGFVDSNGYAWYLGQPQTRTSGHN